MSTSIYGPGEEQNAIWVYLEHDQGAYLGVSLELLSKGRELADQVGWPLVGLLMGYEVSGLADQTFSYGADEVWLAEHPLLELFTVDAYAHVAYQAITQAKPCIFLCGATPNGRDLAGRLAVRLRTGLNADCTNLYLDAQRGVLVCEISGFGGGILALIEMRQHRPQMATVRPGVFSTNPEDNRINRTITEFPFEISPDLIKTRVVERKAGQGVDLTKTPVLVAGGRGVHGDFKNLRKLAALLNGDVGATRPAVDEGHIERERQIGQTGVVCSPKVAICCGLSGAFHFVVGIEKADMVIAINTDPEAPIFDYADYCIVGDYRPVITALIDQLTHSLKHSSPSPKKIEVVDV